MKKEVYSQPVSEIYELKLLGSVLQGGSPDVNWSNTTNSPGGNDIIDDGEEF